MRSSLIAFAFTAAITTTSLLQAQTQSFPWRTESGVQPVVSPELRQSKHQSSLAAQINARPTTPVQQQVQTAPQPIRVAQQSSPYLISYGNRQDQGLGDAQPSVSDLKQQVETTPVIQNNVQPVPATPQNYSPSSVLQGPPAVPGSAPAQEYIKLGVVSNATAETNYCDRNCKRDFCNLGCERKLFGTSPRGLEIGGWLSVGYHNRDNIMLNNRKGEANLNQAWLYIDKAASQDCPDWDFGYRLDTLYGIDGQDLQAFGNPPAGAPTGWDNSWDYGSYGWALPQAYIQFANDTWDVKLGKFFSPFGYEVIAAPDNFFYSHSYTMYYSEPFTMSGILAERQVTDSRSMIIGATAGWDTGFESDTGGCLITGQRIQLNENVNLALTTCFGDRGRRGVGSLNTAVAEVRLTEDVTYVFQGDFLNFGTNQEFGIVQYLFRDVTECLSLGARLEWWKSDQLYTDTKSTYEYTMGANYRINSNVTFRPEVRWDWGAAAIDPGTTIVGFDFVATF